jgi:hypothetical protein
VAVRQAVTRSVSNDNDEQWIFYRHGALGAVLSSVSLHGITILPERRHVSYAYMSCLCHEICRYCAPSMSRVFQD